MKYETYLPCEQLQPFIKAFAISENTEASIYKILPDTSVVIGFQYKGSLSHMTQQGEVSLAASGISGLNDTYKLFKNAPDIGTVLVFFKEAGASAFFKQSLHELFKESVGLDNLMLRSELLIVEEQLQAATSDSSRINIVEQFLLSLLRDTSTDELVAAAIAMIYNSKGNIKIKELCERLFISQSPLEKRFRSAVGCTPKKFASIVRFKHITQQSNTANTLTELGYSAGFYDQAHFIKEFKQFTGETPESFFGKE